MEDYWYVLRDLARPNAKNPAYKQLQQLPAVGEAVRKLWNSNPVTFSWKNTICYIYLTI